MPRNLIVSLPCTVDALRKALASFDGTDTVNTNYLDGSDALFATTMEDDTLFEESSCF